MNALFTMKKSTDAGWIKKIIKKEKFAGQKPDATIIWIQSGTRITHFVEANVFYAAVHTCFFWTEIVTKQPSTSFCILHQNPHPVYIYVRQWLRLYSHSQHYSLRVREYFVSFFYHVSVFFLIINFFKWAVVERGMTVFAVLSLSFSRKINGTYSIESIQLQFKLSRKDKIVLKLGPSPCQSISIFGCFIHC